jgi:hypothetical protein
MFRLSLANCIIILLLIVMAPNFPTLITKTMNVIIKAYL